MKKLYIAIAFLIIALGLCVFEQYTVQSAYHQTTEYIDNAMEGLEKNDYKAVEKNCDMLSKYWNKKYPIMTAMIDHGPLDDASVTINSLNDLAKNKSDELETQLITAKNQMKNIHDNQCITFGNIF